MCSMCARCSYMRVCVCVCIGLELWRFAEHSKKNWMYIVVCYKNNNSMTFIRNKLQVRFLCLSNVRRRRGSIHTHSHGSQTKWIVHKINQIQHKN